MKWVGLNTKFFSIIQMIHEAKVPCSLRLVLDILGVRQP